MTPYDPFEHHSPELIGTLARMIADGMTRDDNDEFDAAVAAVADLRSEPGGHVGVTWQGDRGYCWYESPRHPTPGTEHQTRWGALWLAFAASVSRAASWSRR